MNVKDLLNISSIKCLNIDIITKRSIDNYYVGDMLSWIMGHVREENCCLLTILNSVNVIAVAVLLEMSAVIFCEGVIPSGDVIKKATEENIALFYTANNSFKMAKEIIAYESIL